jgi:hypothetical protein
MTRKAIFFLLIILFISSLFFNKREGFDKLGGQSLGNPLEGKNIVLLGDSVFFNDAYVKVGNSVCDKLKKKINKQSKLYCLAENDALIVDIYTQLANIDRESLNKKNTTVFVSVGGNDILNFYKNNSIDKNDDSKDNMNVIFNAYLELIEAIIARLPLVKLKLFNIYSPLSKDYLIYNKPIRKWNELLYTKFKLNRNVTIINNFGFMNQREDFSFDIEPSPIGSQKIANAILVNA